MAQHLVLGREEKIARRWQAWLDDGSRSERRAFLRALSIEPGPENIVLGAIENSRERWGWVGLLADRLVGFHGVLAGASGSGKTSWLIGILLQILARLRLSLILPDFKGETADLLLDVGIPFLLENGLEVDLLDNLRVIRPFDHRYVPLLNLTLPEAGVPAEAQAYGVAAAVEQALAEPLGGRMHHCLVEMVVVCIELGLPITVIIEWLSDPRSFVAAAARSANEATRQYARVGFPQENRESLRALVARLNALLFWPGARQALCAPGAVSFADALAAPGITVISTGGAPAGSERLARFFAGALLGKIVRAILSRDITPDTPPALLVCEEVTEALGWRRRGNSGDSSRSPGTSAAGFGFRDKVGHSSRRSIRGWLRRSARTRAFICSSGPARRTRRPSRISCPRRGKARPGGGSSSIRSPPSLSGTATWPFGIWASSPSGFSRRGSTSRRFGPRGRGSRLKNARGYSRGSPPCRSRTFHD